MSASDDIARIKTCISNRLDRSVLEAKPFAAVIGDAPSRYSKSPSLWNAAFQALKMNAIYVPLDVDGGRLPELLQALKNSERCLGINVTVPHKLAVLNYLDAMDENAVRIGAVNTITRTQEGKLIGANTDGEGFAQSLSALQPGSEAPLIESLKGINALVLGAGGSARAVAFALAERLVHGRLYIANRTYERAHALAAEIGQSSVTATAIREEEIPEHATRVELIVNCTTKGQGSLGNGSGGALLEPYSAMAPAHPDELRETVTPLERLAASLAGIEANNDASWKLALSLPPGIIFYDLIYHPAETVFLRHGRVSGHRTLNGRGMIIAQAAEGFFNHICRRQLEEGGLHTAATRSRVLEVMTEAW
jgi:shikimate dehydrogenase